MNKVWMAHEKEDGVMRPKCVVDERWKELEETGGKKDPGFGYFLQGCRKHATVPT